MYRITHRADGEVVRNYTERTTENAYARAYYTGRELEREYPEESGVALTYRVEVCR